MNVSFGKTKTTQVIDDNGSTKTTERNYMAGEVTKPSREYFEYRHKVQNEKEEHEAYLDFSLSLHNDKTMLDPAFRIERSKIGDKDGYYFVVKCYTRLVY